MKMVGPPPPKSIRYEGGIGESEQLGPISMPHRGRILTILTVLSLGFRDQTITLVAAQVHLEKTPLNYMHMQAQGTRSQEYPPPLLNLVGSLLSLFPFPTPPLFWLVYCGAGVACAIQFFRAIGCS